MEKYRLGIPIPKFLLFIMRITFFLFVIGVMQMYAADSYAQKTHLTIHENNIKLGTLFNQIESQTDFYFFYNNDIIDKDLEVSVNVTNKTIFEILNIALKDTDITYQVNNKAIILTLIDSKYIAPNQNQKQVTGTVSDERGEPIIGANIIEKGTTNGTVTDYDGNFSINVANDAVLVVSYIGYLQQDVNTSGRNSVSVRLVEDTQALEELVVVGYGTQKKVNLTGAVGNIQMEDLDSRPLTNSSVALQGKISGLYALQKSGKPSGDDAVINIRGVGTLNNSDPLILVDGFPGNMNDVNPSDIESISVLKDASSAAIYGNRAANGVILVTTRRGGTGKMSVTYNGYIGVQEATSLPNVFNAVDYATLYNEAAINTGMQPKYTEDEIKKYASGNDPMYPNINYFDVYYGSAKIQNHRVNMSGGSENLKYAFMLGMLDQDGILIGTNYRKIDFRSNFDSYFLKDNKLRLSVNLSGNKGDTGQPTDEWYAKWYATNSPIWPLKNADDQWVAVIGERNYYGEIQEGSTTKIERYVFNAQAEVEYKFTNDLSAQVTYGYNIIDSNSNSFHANVLLANLDGSTRYLASDLTETDRRDSQSLLTGLIKYNKTLGKHGIDLLAGYSEEEFSWQWSSGFRSNFVNNTQRILNLGDPSTMRNNSGAYELGLQSTFGRLICNFDGKYLFEANVRRDGSSRFAKNNRWGTFPSFSAGWIITEENTFLNKLDWLDFLKLRVSWGQLGNQNINSYYAASDILTTAQDYSLNGSLNSGVAITSLSNKETTWETTEQTNIGLDITVLKSLNFTMDYFHKSTKNILMQTPIPITMGNLSAPYQNIGQVNNSGVELTASYKKTFSNDLKLNTTFGISHINNKITNLGGRSPIISSPKALVEGYAINAFYGYIKDGIYQISDFTWQNNSDSSIPHGERDYMLKDGVVKIENFTPTPGDVKYRDLSGDGVVTMDEDRTIIGKQYPDLGYSLQVNLDWKNFDFGIFLQGVHGIQGYTYYEIGTPFSGTASNVGSWWKERWTPENPTNKLPKLTLDGVRNDIHSEVYMEDASYLRLKNIELGYTLNKNLTSSIGINYLRLFANIQNALTFTKFRGFDPEQTVDETRAQAYPQVRIFSVGLNVNF